VEARLWVVLFHMLKNTGAGRKTQTGWTLRDASGHVFKFPTVRLGGGNFVKIHEGRGSNSSSNLYWRSSSYVWNNHETPPGFERRTVRSSTRVHTQAPVLTALLRGHVGGEHRSRSADRRCCCGSIQIEADWNAGKGGRGSQAARRELEAAYDDYMTHHAQDIE
jgi:hypothetical protein